MEKVNFNYQPQPQVVNEMEHLANQLRQESLIQELCEKFPAMEKQLSLNPYRFETWLHQKKQCQHCHGLFQCSLKSRGQLLEPEMQDGFIKEVLTPCRYSQQEKQERKHLVNYLMNDLPQKAETLTFEQLTLDEANYNAVAKRVVEWTMNPHNPGLYLVGPVGCGKTFLAAAVCNYLARNGQKIAFIHVPSWLSRLKAMVTDREALEHQFYLFKKADLVVMDDIGAEDVTSWIRDEILLPLLNYRMENEKMTWFTSNEDMDSLLDHYRYTKTGGKEEIKAVRLMERIKTLSTQVLLNSRNRRVSSF